jgi:hypothetical protein
MKKILVEDQELYVIPTTDMGWVGRACHIQFLQVYDLRGWMKAIINNSSRSTTCVVG